MNDPINQYFNQNLDRGGGAVRIGTCTCASPEQSSVFAALDELPTGLQISYSAGTRHNWNDFKLSTTINRLDPKDQKKRTPKWLLRDALTTWNTVRSVAPDLEAVGREMVVYKGPPGDEEADEEVERDMVMVMVPAKKQEPAGLVANILSLLQKVVVEHGEHLKYDIPALCALWYHNPDPAAVLKAAVLMLPRYFDGLPRFLKNPQLTESALLLAGSAFESPLLAGPVGRMASFIRATQAAPSPQQLRLQDPEEARALRKRVQLSRQKRRHGC